MRRLVACARATLVLSMFALAAMPRPFYAQTAAQRGAHAGLRDSLLALDRRWGQAYVHADSAFVAGFVADDWRGWFDEHADDKSSVMAAVGGAPHSLEDIVDQATVRVFGQMAVIQARERNRVLDAGGGHWVTRHITDVFVHRPEGWVVVASHDSRIPNP
jgi:hypothetical protein